ncbi:MAG TPA: NAD(P)/FAD-dependent oxidoreductase [Blastocatellia bacterium]|nr:NAD(P)/FAD-dependent oxidoreductase [Blastocatellia bacterium]
MQANQTYDAIIIGGGVAGLTAATLVARAGRRVRLIEQAHALGGRARTKTQDGFHFNIGPHALYRGGRGLEILGELGVKVSGRMPEVSGAFAIKDGAKHTFPSGITSLLTTGLFGLSAKLEAMRWLAALAKIDTESLMHVSLREWLDRYITHREVQDFLIAAMRIATYTNATDLLSAGAAIKQLQLAFAKGVLYLDGGWQTIVDGLRDAALAASVEIETGAKVERVEREANGAVRGVRTADGQLVYTSSVVIAASPQIAAGLVEQSEQTRLARWADSSLAVKAACLDVALHRLPKPKALYAFGIDRPLYLSVHSASARLAPAGGALIHVAKYLAPDEDTQPVQVERELKGLLDLVQPGWQAVVAHRRFLPEMTVMNALALATQGGTAGRPGPQVDEVPGLYVVGDWVGNEGMLVDSSLASARRAAERITAARTFRVRAIV